MPCDWKGNRRSGVALATRHIDFSGLSTYSVRANAYGREMRTPPTLPVGYGTLYLYLVISVNLTVFEVSSLTRLELRLRYIITGSCM